MSFLKNIFNNNNNTTSKVAVTSNVNWLPITELSQLDVISEISNTQKVLIFKHSTRCVISKMVLKQFETALNASEKEITVYYLDLLNYRNISDEIAAKFQLFHQSPQLIVLKNGVVAAHASHHDILGLEF